MKTITVEYTTDDDGIHLQCECGWDGNCDISPTIDDLVQIADEHQATHEADMFPASLLRVFATAGLVLGHPDAVVRILDEATNDLRARLSEIITELRDDQATDHKRPCEASDGAEASESFEAATRTVDAAERLQRAHSGSWQCRECDSHEVVYEQNAFDPPDVRLRCLACGKTFPVPDPPRKIRDNPQA